MAAPGTRNPELLRECSLLGGMCVEGTMTRQVAERLMILACKYNGLLAEDGLKQCRDTIRSGLEDGIRYWGLPLGGDG
jgi:hypothetical protein